MFAKKKDEEVKSTVENKTVKNEEAKEISPLNSALPKELKKEVIQAPSQRDIVYMRLCELVKEKKLIVKKNQPVMEAFNSDLLELLYQLVSNDFLSGKATMKDTPSNKEKLNDSKKLRIYVKGLCANWLRRDPRLNGDTEFTVK